MKRTRILHPNEIAVLIAEVTPDSLHLSSLAMGLIGGLALFLFGMDQMSDALKLIAGDVNRAQAVQPRRDVMYKMAMAAESDGFEEKSFFE